MSQDRHRRAENQALRREANERILDVIVHIEAVGRASIDVICECGDDDCRSLFPMDEADYAQIRADDALYVVARGHERDEFERVVRRADGYSVVARPDDP
jgi:hypothetical protein